MQRVKKSRSHGVRDERGEILVLVLTVLIVVGVLVGALAALAAPIFAHAAVVQNVNETVATADSGIQYGIQQVQINVPTGAPLVWCPVGSFGGLPNPPSPMINGRSVVIMCEIQSQPANGLSIVVIASTVPPGSGNSRVISARAVFQVNNSTGAWTVQSWRTCQDGTTQPFQGQPFLAACFPTGPTG
jgi:hypothetical protein